MNWFDSSIPCQRKIKGGIKTEKKICSICHQELPISEFYHSGKTKLGKQRIASVCKQCSKEREIKRYNKQCEELSKLKTKCVKCGIEKKYLLEFHHRDPNEKEFTIAHWRKRSFACLLEEANKCDILCKNCHAEFHYINNHYGVSYKDYINDNFCIS